MIILCSPTTSRPRRKLKPAGILAALLLVISGAARAGETTWLLLVEPKFMRPAFAEPVPGSKTTVIAPGLLRDGAVAYLNKDDAARLKLDLTAARRLALANAAADLATLQPEYVRDRNGVILFARLDSPRPTAAGMVLTPEFAALFKDTLGPDLLVAIPNRYRVYVYPALDQGYADTAELVQRDYQLSGERVSRELFRLTPQGLRAVGAFAEN